MMDLRMRGTQSHAWHRRCIAAICAAVLLCASVQAQASPAGTVDGANVLMIGHSLVNFDMPAMFKGLADDAGKAHQRAEQIIIGSPLKHNWENSHTAQGVDARVALPTSTWNVLVMTEAIPLQNHLTWSDTYVYAGNFHQLARNGNANTRTYIYETWHCIYSGTPTGCAWDDGDALAWRQRLDLDRTKWQGIADHLNLLGVGPTVELVPAGRALGLLHDRAAAGQVPGLSSVFNLFTDDIHLSNAGNYFVALVMYATIYRASPQGLTHQINDQWGNAYPNLPSATTAAAMQEIAWEAVSTHFGWSDRIFAHGFDRP
jgi:hypothetical protein